jgi:hypothetical protein
LSSSSPSSVKAPHHDTPTNKQHNNTTLSLFVLTPSSSSSFFLREGFMSTHFTCFLYFSFAFSFGLFFFIFIWQMEQHKMSSYKEEKEAFVSNLHGTTMGEVALVALTIPVRSHNIYLFIFNLVTQIKIK